MAIEFQFYKMKRAVDDGDVYTTVRMYLMPLNCYTLKWLRWQILYYVYFNTTKKRGRKKKEFRDRKNPWLAFSLNILK